MDERNSRSTLGNEDEGNVSGEAGGGKSEHGGKGLSSPNPEILSIQEILCREDSPSVDGRNLEESVEPAVREKQLSAASETTANLGEEKLKPMESRSQYHSIQQLSLPSSKSSGSVPNRANKTPTFYKLADFVSQPSCKNAKLQSTGDDDYDDDEDGGPVGGERFPATVLQGLRDGVGFWKGLQRQKPTYDSRKAAAEFSEDDEEFFRPGIRDVTDCSDELSDVGMSYDGSVSQTGSAEEEEEEEEEAVVGQSDRPGVEDSTPERDAASAGGREVRMEAKRARVESIIKTMTPMTDSCSVQGFSNCREFPTTTTTFAKISGGNTAGNCDERFPETRRPKRKQYIPQQVDPRNGDGDGGPWPPAAKICARERNAVRNGLQKMEEELAEMQLKYQHLLKRDREISFQMSDAETEGQGQGRMSSAKSFSFSLADVNQNEVKNKELRRNYVSGAYDVNKAEVESVGGMAGSGLERLANILKAQITKEVERLIDSLFMPLMTGNFRSRATREEKANQRETLDHVRSTYDVIVNGNGSQMEHESEDQIKEETGRRSSGAERQNNENLSQIDRPEVDEPSFPVTDAAAIQFHQKRQSTPTPPLSESNYHVSSRGVNDGPGTGSDSRLSSVPHHRLPVQFFLVHGSPSDSASHGLDRDGSMPAAISDKYYFDNQVNRGAFGMARPPLPLFGSHHPPPALYYPQCLGKFPQNFLKDQEQVEPLPLIVGPPKKSKRTKVIDRVSPRVIKSISLETTTQLDEGQPQLRSPESPGKPAFHHSSRYHHTGAPTHDVFPHPHSLLQFGLAPPTAAAMAIHNPSLHQHSKFIQAMYSQMSSIGQRVEQTPSSSLPSPGHKSPLCSADVMVTGSKSAQKSNDYEAMTCNDTMMTMSGLGFTSTLTPMHLRKAKLMFFYVRYPSSSILKVYFPDVKFNKNNTAQLVKWFSNFREFYYIQMEKYARQSLAEGVKSAKDLIVTSDSELYRILVVHYNRNCQIEVPVNFRFVVQATLREFFTSIAAEKDQEPSWKKTIYKVIQRMDDPVPEYFKSPNWMERLVDG